MIRPSAALVVARRELLVFFTSPIAFALITIFLVVTGYLFQTSFSYFSLLSFQVGRNPYLSDLTVNQVVLGPTFGNMAVILLFILPLLTMRLLAEEKKTGTLELLRSYPVKGSEIIAGKFAAAWNLFLVMLVPTALFPILAGIWAETDLGPVLTAYLGLILLGGAYISLGLFISSLTENQIVAAALTLGALMILWQLDGLAKLSTSPAARMAADLSIIGHFDNFAQGIIDSHDLIYYLLFTFFFLFLTSRSLESHRWRS